MKREHPPSKPSNRRANILISVLWAIVILAVIVLGLNYEARSDIERTIHMRDRVKAYWIARGAVERAKFEYAVQRQEIQGPTTPADIPNRFTFDGEDGHALVELRSQSGLMFIHTSPRNREMWGQLFTLYALDDQRKDAILDALTDWIDPDDLPSLNGAEADYYQSLTPRYRPRNAPFLSVDELLLVRGISEAMFYGTPGPNGVPGLQDILSNDRRPSSRFDINTCPIGILMAFLEIDRASAESIIQARTQEPFQNINDVNAVVSVGRPDLLTTYFTPNQSTQFTIRSTGLVHDSPARYTVEEEVRYIGGANLFSVNTHNDFSLKHLDEADNAESMDE